MEEWKTPHHVSSWRVVALGKNSCIFFPSPRLADNRLCGSRGKNWVRTFLVKVLLTLWQGVKHVFFENTGLVRVHLKQEITFVQISLCTNWLLTPPTSS